MDEEYNNNKAKYIFKVICYSPQVIVKIIVEYASMCDKCHALLGRVTGASTPAEQAELRRISSQYPVAATLLPLRSVGVQGTVSNFIR